MSVQTQERYGRKVETDTTGSYFPIPYFQLSDTTNLIKVAMPISNQLYFIIIGKIINMDIIGRQLLLIP